MKSHAVIYITNGKWTTDDASGKRNINTIFSTEAESHKTHNGKWTTYTASCKKY